MADGRWRIFFRPHPHLLVVVVVVVVVVVGPKHTSSLDTDLTRNTRAPHFTPQHWLLCHMGLY